MQAVEISYEVGVYLTFLADAMQLQARIEKAAKGVNQWQV
jgi:hypothetical protein